MKRFTLMLPMIILLVFSSCRDRVTGETDHDIKIEDNDANRMQNPATATRTEAGEKEDHSSYITTEQMNDLHQKLNLTPEQEKRLREMHNSSSNSDSTYSNEADMDQDYNQVLNGSQITNYQNWKKQNLQNKDVNSQGGGSNP